MGSSFSGGPAFTTDAKEYARFCRLHGLFMVDGLGDPASDFQGAEPKTS